MRLWKDSGLRKDAVAGIEERRISIDGLETRYLAAGEGPPLVLLHGAGQSAIDWSRVLASLRRRHRVYAPDLPGAGDSAKPPADYSSAFYARFVAAFLDRLGTGPVALAGNSFGGLVALRLALHAPERVTALGLIDSAGLGRAVNPALLSLLVPGYGESAVLWSKTPLGAAQRSWLRATLMFARPERAPQAWLEEQDRLARIPGFLEATLTQLRAGLDLDGQREVLLPLVPRLPMPALVLWGDRDQVFPAYHARAALCRLRQGRLAIIPDCGHLPQVERPDLFAEALGRFLKGREQPAAAA